MLGVHVKSLVLALNQPKIWGAYLQSETLTAAIAGPKTEENSKDYQLMMRCFRILKLFLDKYSKKE